VAKRSTKSQSAKKPGGASRRGKTSKAKAGASSASQATKAKPKKPAQATRGSAQSGKAKPAAKKTRKKADRTVSGDRNSRRTASVKPRPRPPLKETEGGSPSVKATAVAGGDSRDRKPAKSKLTPNEVAEFRELLLNKRAEMVGDVGNLTDEALRNNRQDAAGDLSLMPNHMADLGSDNWEQEFTLGLLQNQQGILREIDEALERIDRGTFGVCLGTGRPISKSRLRAKPWAKYCIEHARMLETGRV